MPKAAQKLKVEESGKVFHDVFHFLRPEEALNLKKLQADVDAGVIDLKEFYDQVAPIFKAEQEAADRPALPGHTS